MEVKRAIAKAMGWAVSIATLKVYLLAFEKFDEYRAYSKAKRRATITITTGFSRWVRRQ